MSFPRNIEYGQKTLHEILQIPNVVRNCIQNPQSRQEIHRIAERIISSGCTSIYCLGSGTSYHAGLVSTYWFAQLAKYPTHCELAPEFPYLVEPIIAAKHITICISQSGESDLTIYAARQAKARGSLVIGITNNQDSSLAQIVGENLLLLRAGVEEGVLATKTYVAELIILAALAVDLAELRGTISKTAHNTIWKEFETLPSLMEPFLADAQVHIRSIAPYFKFTRNCFVIGAGPDYGNCMECALKLMEGAKIFSQAFSTAETPHGPIILLGDPRDAFVLCIIPRREAISRHSDILKLIARIKERGITILGIKNPDDSIPELDFKINIPECSEMFQPLLSILPVQLLVKEIASIQNIDCDTPMFLSKVSKL
jgi:glucosamine--fructose-6-phosphate aminotransferase (isomerizing)